MSRVPEDTSGLRRPEDDIDRGSNDSVGPPHFRFILLEVNMSNVEARCCITGVSSSSKSGVASYPLAPQNPYTTTRKPSYQDGHFRASPRIGIKFLIAALRFAYESPVSRATLKRSPRRDGLSVSSVNLFP